MSLDSLAKWAGVVAIVVLVTGAELPQAPAWSGLLVTGLLAGALVALIAGGRIAALLPEDEPDVIVREVASDRTDTGVYGFSKEAFAESVIHGKLRHLADAEGEQYEAYRVNDDPSWTDNPGVDEDHNPPAVISGIWMGQEHDSRIVGHYRVEDAHREITQIKSEYEDLAAAGRILIEHFPSVLRKLDRDRAVRWVQQLGGDVAGDVGEKSDIDQAIRDVLPMQLIPARMFTPDEHKDRESDDTDDDTAGDAEDGPTVGQAIDTLMRSESGDVAAATDGGTDE